MPPRTPLTRYRHILNLLIHRCALPRVAKEFLWEALERTLETAAQQEQAGVAPLTLWCAFVQEEWATALRLDEATLEWTRTFLVTASVLRFEPDPAAPSNGILRWNLAFDEWQPLQPGPSDTTCRGEGCSTTDASDRRASADAPQDALAAPEVALAQRWKGRPPRQAWWALRRAVLERDDWSCQYCGTRTGPLACDHLIPVSRGGASVLENLVTACTACNSAKGTRTLAEWLSVMVRQERSA